MLDSLSAVKELEAAGFPREQAEAQVMVLMDIIKKKQEMDRRDSVIEGASKADFATCRDQVFELTLMVEALKEQVAVLLSERPLR